MLVDITKLLCLGSLGGMTLNYCLFSLTLNVRLFESSLLLTKEQCGVGIPLLKLVCQISFYETTNPHQAQQRRKLRSS